MLIIIAFLWPLIVHVLDQPNLKAGDGPIGLILGKCLARENYLLIENLLFITF